MITELTEAQKELSLKYKEIGRARGFCTDRADRPLAEKSVAALYARVGKKTPRMIWARSPLEANYLIDFLKDAKDLDIDGLDAEGIINKFNAPKKFDSVASLFIYGQQDSYWICFNKFCEEIGAKYKPETIELLNVWDDLSKACNWVYTYEYIAILVDRPTVCKLENGLKHCLTGPYIAYPDGFALYGIEGHIVPEFVVMRPHEITIEKIEKEDNAEVRRIMIDRYKENGIGDYLRDTGAKVIDFDTTRSLLRDNKGNQFLQATDKSTKRIYFMAVDDEAKTCKEAHESICGISESRIVQES